MGGSDPDVVPEGGEAAAFPGVYKASFDGAPLSAAQQKRYKQENKSALGRGGKPARSANGPAKRAAARKPTTTAAQRRATKAAITRMAGG